MFYDFVGVLLVTHDEKLLCGCSFAHITFDAACSVVGYFEAESRRSFLLSGDPAWYYSRNQRMFFNL